MLIWCDILMINSKIDLRPTSRHFMIIHNKYSEHAQIYLFAFLMQIKLHNSADTPGNTHPLFTASFHANLQLRHYLRLLAHWFSQNELATVSPSCQSSNVEEETGHCVLWVCSPNIDDHSYENRIQLCWQKSVQREYLAPRCSSVWTPS